MAVSTAGSIRRRKASTPVRRIGHEDLSIALRQGFDDFRHLAAEMQIGDMRDPDHRGTAFGAGPSNARQR